MVIIDVWINAFIPLSVPGYTLPISSGTHRGKTAVPLPKLARVNPFNLFKAFNTGYLTDQRDFDSTMGASVRMQSRAQITLSSWGAMPVVTKAVHTTSGTTQVTITNGDETGKSTADMTACKWSPMNTRLPSRPQLSPVSRFPSVRYPMSGNPTYELAFYGAASDPLVSASADINYRGMFEFYVDPSAHRIQVFLTANVDEFPAFESYVSSGGQTKTMFIAPPPKGNTVVDLLGEAKRSFRGTAEFAYL
jgi:hypothetical protein